MVNNLSLTTPVNEEQPSIKNGIEEDEQQVTNPVNEEQPSIKFGSEEDEQQLQVTNLSRSIAPVEPEKGERELQCKQNTMHVNEEQPTVKVG
eukprot:c23482_g1_i3 orf=3-275(-)